MVVGSLGFPFGLFVFVLFVLPHISKTRSSEMPMGTDPKTNKQKKPALSVAKGPGKGSLGS